jgi:vancomycin resistance protein VanJ
MGNDKTSGILESGDQKSRDDTERRKAQRIVDILAGITCATLLGILVLYLTVSDRHPLGEFLTIWPPVLYLVPSVVILGILGWRNSNRLRTVSAAIIALFVVTLIEWRPLLRFSGGQGDITVVTWNIGGGTSSESELLKSLEEYRPDLVFFQESPDHVDAFGEKALPAAFEGYHYYDSGDCALLSRWPCEVLESESVGPWAKPQILIAEIEGRHVLLVNVRLMLPALVLNPLDARSREKLWSDNRIRREQYPLLVELIEATQKQHRIDHVILAGDFNADASAKSLDVIRRAFTDTWRESGSGWGGTAISQFPVARIDHVYARSIRPESVRVMRSSLSDHLPVVATLSFDQGRSE